MSTNSRLHKAVRLALGVGAGSLAASYAPGALAQQSAADDAPIEEIITTGSRIKRADIASASPITVLTRDEIQMTGLVDVGDLLQRMPSMSGSPIGTTTNNGGNGSVLVDLRGMGTDRTVTLINGQRMVDGGDYQTIPATMIERVEILKDGASAVYGADAVAGVVNIITRRDFQGIELSAQQADWFDSKGAQYTIGLISGFETERGNFVFGAEYVNQEEAFQADTPWEFMKDSFYIYPEGCEQQLLEPYPTGCYRLGSSIIPESRLLFQNQGLFLIGTPASAPYEAGLMTPHDGRNYNYAPVNYIQTPYERFNLFAEAHFDVADNVRFNGQIRGNFRESAQELAQTPYFHVFGLFDPAWQGTFNGQPVSGISPDNFYLRQAVDNFNAANPGANLVYEPVVDLRRRMLERPRRFEQEITQWQMIGGLEGTFAEWDLDWDVFFNYGWRSRQDQDFGQFSGARLQNALGPSADLNGDGQPECYGDINNPASLIEGCVPLNLFGGGGVVRETGAISASSVTADMYDYISFPLNDSFITKHTIGGGSVTGDAFELPGGTLGWAAGVSYWRQEFKFVPDSGKTTGAVTGNTSTPTEGSLTNEAVFLEVLAPLFDNGIQEVFVKAGVRYDDYDAFDGDTTWQLGIEFQAVESLKVRGTAGTVFRAPTISDLFAGLFDSFPTFSDPCDPAAGPIAPGCAQEAPSNEAQLLARIGGNPNLEPETGDTITAGIVWQPQFGDHDITATVDYWDIQLDDGISSLGVQFILEDCYDNLNQASCALITRRQADYGIAQVLDGPLNVAEQSANGIDTEIRWSFESDIGQWQAAFLWTHLLERTKTAFPGDAEEDLSGRYTDPTAEDGGGYPDDKFNYSLQWAWNDLSIGYLGEYISSIDSDTFCNCDSDLDPSNNQPDGSYILKVDSYLYHDLVANYTVGDTGLMLTAGITNLTDEEPPFIEVGFNATSDPPIYRMFGTGYYVRAQWEF